MRAALSLPPLTASAVPKLLQQPPPFLCEKREAAAVCDAVSLRGDCACGICAIIYVVTRFIYCGFHGRLPLPEIVLLVLMSICICAANRAYRVIELPRYFGRTVDPAPSAKPKRILLYALTGLMLGASWTMVDFFGNVTDWGSAPLRIAADIGITSVVCAVCETVIGEIKVHRYNRETARLEAEENDLGD